MLIYKNGESLLTFTWGKLGLSILDTCLNAAKDDYSSCNIPFFGILEKLQQ